MAGIRTTGNHEIDNATAEIAVYLRDATPGLRDQHYYDVAMGLRDHIRGEAERIIGLLADQDAPVMDGTYANGHDWCTMCGGEGSRPEDHDADCPWRLAREYRLAQQA